MQDKMCCIKPANYGKRIMEKMIGRTKSKMFLLYV